MIAEISSYTIRTMIYTITYQSEDETDAMAVFYNIDLEQFKKDHATELLFELLKK